MKIFKTSQIRELDNYTIEHEPIFSIDLMERAATRFIESFKKEVPSTQRIFVFAGPGNNGGDALAISRLLLQESYQVEIFLFNIQNNLSADCKTNKAQLLSLPDVPFSEIIDSFSPPKINKGDIVIDGLFGSGLNKPLTGGFASVIKYINQSEAKIYSIDIPSGLFGEDNTHNTEDTIIKAYKTFTFQTPKLSFFFPENEVYTGEWEVIDIELHPNGINKMHSSYFYTEEDDIQSQLLTRSKFAHKGNFGHALLIAGSYGKMGAAVLAAKACMRSGVGLLTTHLPNSGNLVMQSSFPEVMVEADKERNHISNTPDIESYSAIGVGPGIGLHTDTLHALQLLLEQSQKPLVLDADALNLIAQNKDLLEKIPINSILTPHPKEFDRIAGNSNSSYERLQKAIHLAHKIHCYIVLKGAYTAICTPDKTCHFNSTGNPGMATAGSGDTLTGIILGLLAQSYTPFNAALIGVYLHGLAGDIAERNNSQESLIASDIIDNIGSAFKKIKE